MITGATANAAGVATVTFTIKNAADNTPVTGRGALANTASFGISSLAPAAGGFSYNKWVSFIWRSSTTDNVAVNQAYRERNTATNLVEGPAGAYTYTFAQNLGTAKINPANPADNTTVTYDRTRTHRVFVALRSGYAGGNTFDFVPAGGAVTATRDIVVDATCRKCHMNTPGHYGPWDGIVKACVTCHAPGNTLKNSAANGGATNTLEMSVMLHKIHAGRELQSVAGADGQFYDNPNTATDETADNGPLYQLGGVSTWNTAGFPAVLANCQACHTGNAANVDNWRGVPSRAACGSCHDLINWTTGTNHTGGSATNDDGCATCHQSAGITTAHNWTNKDARNIPEFNVTITANTPSRGYYINGESPVISIVLRDAKTDTVISPASVVEDGTAEGCTPVFNANGTVTCAAVRDGLFRSASMYVTGPRAERIPVLHYAARAMVRSSPGIDNTRTWDLSAGVNLGLIVDGGIPLRTYNNEINYEGYGQEELFSGSITVKYVNSFFLDNTHATSAEIANWLNADVRFHERAIAYVDEALGSTTSGSTNAGRLAIRSRGVTKLDRAGNVVEGTNQPSISIVGTGPGNLFPLNTTTGLSAYGVPSGSTQVRIRTTASNTDPKANFTDTTAIQYTLDPVDDLVPGTYLINVEFADAGRGAEPAVPAGVTTGEPPYTNYVTPSVAVAMFQVKKATADKPVAYGCGACHWSDAGRGFVLDQPRHNKPFTDNAADQCAGCHDYNSGENPAISYPVFPPAGPDAGFGGHPLSKRVHAVHNGSALNYPYYTVAHEETAAFGRNWNITYPMPILNCESCHGAATGGTWKTNPNRLACMGCHDSDAATTHMQLQTYDPTPNAPFSGDEREACKSCH